MYNFTDSLPSSHLPPTPSLPQTLYSPAAPVSDQGSHFPSALYCLLDLRNGMEWTLDGSAFILWDSVRMDRDVLKPALGIRFSEFLSKLETYAFQVHRASVDLALAVTGKTPHLKCRAEDLPKVLDEVFRLDRPETRSPSGNIYIMRHACFRRDRPNEALQLKPRKERKQQWALPHAVSSGCFATEEVSRYSDGSHGTRLGTNSTLGNTFSKSDGFSSSSMTACSEVEMQVDKDLRDRVCELERNAAQMAQHIQQLQQLLQTVLGLGADSQRDKPYK